MWRVLSGYRFSVLPDVSSRNRWCDGCTTARMFLCDIEHLNMVKTADSTLCKCHHTQKVEHSKPEVCCTEDDRAWWFRGSSLLGLMSPRNFWAATGCISTCFSLSRERSQATDSCLSSAAGMLPPHSFSSLGRIYSETCPPELW